MRRLRGTNRSKTLVEMWWPRGYGPQALYEVKVELVHENDGILDTRCSKFAFRTVELVRERDDSEAENATSESFYLRVNGVPVYCKVL